MDDQETQELYDRINRLEEAVKLLIGNCSCSLMERLSGHLVDCPVPQLKELFGT